MLTEQTLHWFMRYDEFLQLLLESNGKVQIRRSCIRWGRKRQLTILHIYEMNDIHLDDYYLNWLTTHSCSHLWNNQLGELDICYERKIGSLVNLLMTYQIWMKLMLTYQSGKSGESIDLLCLSTKSDMRHTMMQS